MNERQRIVGRIAEHRKQALSYEESAKVFQREGRSPGYWKRARESAARARALAKQLEASLIEFDRKELQMWLRRNSP